MAGEERLDNTNKFTFKAKAYSLGRADYAKSFIDYLVNSLSLSSQTTVADIGSGTGKFSKQLLEKGATVYAVEPNDDMRLVAENELSCYSGFISIKGSSCDTTLQSGSVDFVTAAQAFHWFEPKMFYNECKRILKPNGKVILLWNSRDEKDEINKEIAEINKKFCPEFKGFSCGMKMDDERIKNFFIDGYEKMIFDNPICFNEESFINRMLSSSYSLKQGDEGYNEFLCEIKRIFLKYESGGEIKASNATVSYIGQI